MNTFELNKNIFIELLNHYPSPHNGQPITLRINDQSNFDLYFDRSRGLQATDISYIFSFVTMGVFTEHMSLCANALGHAITFTYALPTEESLKGTGQVLFAHCKVSWETKKTSPELAKELRARQTSRKKYFKAVTSTSSETLVKIAASNNMTLHQLSPDKAKQAIWLNQRAVFDDMFDEPVRQELDKWLRYDQEQKQTKKDGLAYDCMELNGKMLKYIVHNPKILRLPIFSWLIKQYYLRTMNDKSSVFYMLTPFKTPRDSFEVGRTLMQIWIQCTREGFYIHPFGTIVSNNSAHQDFLNLAGIDNETRDNSYLSFIFRAGKSDSPTQSLRLPVEKHLMKDFHD